MNRPLGRRVANFLDSRLHEFVRFPNREKGLAPYPCVCAACVKLRTLGLDRHGHAYMCDVHRHIWQYDMPHPCNCNARLKYAGKWWRYSGGIVRESLAHETHLARLRGNRRTALQEGVSIVARALFLGPHRFDKRSRNPFRRGSRTNAARQGGRD